MIPLNTVRILNTSVNVLDFPATSTITELGFEPGVLHLRHTAEDVWPPVGFETTTQQATLWVIMLEEGGWVAAGVERIRPGQHDKPEGTNPTDFIMHWVEGRPFGPFNGHTFTPGETIGVFVVAGNSRLAGDFAVRERTHVVEVQVPGPGGAMWPPFQWVEGSADPQPSPAPTPEPLPDPTPEPLPDLPMVGVIERLELLETMLRATATAAGRVLTLLQTMSDQQNPPYRGEYQYPASIRGGTRTVRLVADLKPGADGVKR